MLEMRDDALPPYFFQEKTAQFLSRGESGGFKVIHPETGEVAKVNVYAFAPGKGILYVDPGLGKTRMAIDTCVRLKLDIDKHYSEADFILVLCSKKALNTWRREWAKWTKVKQGQVVIVEPKGSNPQLQRKRLWDRYKSGGRIFVSTYQSGANDLESERLPPELAAKIKMVIADECKIWINRKTKNFISWQRFIQKVQYFIPMEGTLVKKGPQDLWTFYNLMKPNMFRSYWKWVNTFCNVVDGGFGQTITGPKNTQGLADLMRTSLIRLKDTHPDVVGSRPPLNRDYKLVEMTDEQEYHYDNLSQHLMTITDAGDIIATPSQMGLAVRLRQLLVCPKILAPSMGYGGAIDHLVQQLEDDPHAVIFTPFAKALPFIEEALVSNGYKKPYILQGGASSKDVRAVEEGFNSSKGAERATLCTIGFAESFELWSAKMCYFVGYEWMQITNYQAEKRLHRLITPHPITAWYYRYMNTVDDRIMDQLNSNVMNVKITFQDYIGALSPHKGE